MPLVRRAVNQIHQGAVRLAPKGDHKHGSGQNVAGINLQSSIHDEIRTSGDMIIGKVGSLKDYALIVHQGSRPHVIRMKGKMLKFEWERGSLLVKKRGRRAQAMFFFKKVNHPGNKRPVRYLTTPMHMFGRMNGFITASAPVSRTRLP